MFATILLIEAALSAFSYLTYSLLDREVLREEGASFFPNSILYIEDIFFCFSTSLSTISIYLLEDYIKD
jgi:hypothetical protein